MKLRGCPEDNSHPLPFPADLRNFVHRLLMKVRHQNIGSGTNNAPFYYNFFYYKTISM